MFINNISFMWYISHWDTNKTNIPDNIKPSSLPKMYLAWGHNTAVYRETDNIWAAFC